MKSVCIVGGGPAGLVTAKKLLQTGHFSVKIFEKKDRIGGIWALDEGSTDGFLSPQTPTNLSKYTVGFSDLSWDSVDLERQASNGFTTERSAKKAPMFPRAWQVNRYLESFREKYLPRDILHLSTEVVEATRSKLEDFAKRWSIKSKNQKGEDSDFEFDYLVVASGFFAQPRPIEQNVSSLPPKSLSVATIHSSQYRRLQDLFPHDCGGESKIVLIIGGGNSSGEVAAAVAQHLSNAQNGLDSTERERYKGYRVLHVTSQPLYALPPFLPVDDQYRTFVPLDLNFYSLAKRASGPIVAGAGLTPVELTEMLHTGLQTTIGSDQSDLGAPGLVPGQGSDRRTVQVALAESYPEFVRSGMIEVVPGRVAGIEVESDSSVFARISKNGTQSTELHGISAVIYATGYSPVQALDFLDADTQTALQYDRESMRLPLLLQQWQTTGDDNLQDIALHGFYEGPYWPIMEMQARLTTRRWLSDQRTDHRPYEESEKLLELRRAMRDRKSNVPQYWLGDYLGYMEEMAAAMDLQRNDGPFQEREGAVSPGRYLWPGDNKAEADRIMSDLHQTWIECNLHGKYVARAAFRAMQGNWNISRRIESRNASFPSGTLTGTASFNPRVPTKDRTEQSFDLEYLYSESGTFTTSKGQTMTASRRYVYRYSETKDELSIWFVKPDNNYEVDYLFHSLAFAPPQEAQEAGACIARADHLCVKDMYWTEYTLPIKGIALPSFSIRHTVKGPEKDYVSTTEYSRPRI